MTFGRLREWPSLLYGWTKDGLKFKSLLQFQARCLYMSSEILRLITNLSRRRSLVCWMPMDQSCWIGKYDGQ